MRGDTRGRLAGASLLCVLVLVPAARSLGQATWATDPLALRDELEGIELLLSRGEILSAADLSAAERIRGGVQAQGTPSMRTRATLVAYLAERAGVEQAARVEESVRAAAAREQARLRTDNRRRSRFVAFRVSLGACVLFGGAYNVLQYLGEGDFARMAAATDSATAESARTQAHAYDIAATATVGALVVALTALVASSGGAATSLP